MTTKRTEKEKGIVHAYKMGIKAKKEIIKELQNKRLDNLALFLMPMLTPTRKRG